jgi:hypothetical protein
MFYGKHTKFQLGLKDGKPLSEQPFGNLGSSVDLSGRKSSSLTTPRCFVFASGKNPIALKCPVYTQMRECHTQDLTKFIRGFSPEQRDVPYAAISTSSLAVAGQGEDLYLNTLFFMSNGTEY